MKKTGISLYPKVKGTQIQKFNQVNILTNFKHETLLNMKHEILLNIKHF